MKSKYDPRHLNRIKTMRALFSWDFGHGSQPTDLAQEAIAQINQINTSIQQSAPKWPLEKINKVDLAILRTAFCELLMHPETPSKVVIDEAIELAKEFGAEASPSFINGVLGAAIKNP